MSIFNIASTQKPIIDSTPPGATADIGYINNGYVEIFESSTNTLIASKPLSEYGLADVITLNYNLASGQDCALILQDDGSLDYLDMSGIDIEEWSLISRGTISYNTANIKNIDSIDLDVHLVPGSSITDYEVSSYHTGTTTEITDSLSTSWIAECVAVDTSTSPVSYIFGRGEGDSTGNKFKRFNIAGTNTGNFGGTGFVDKIKVEPGTSGRFVTIETSNNLILRSSTGTELQTVYSAIDVYDMAYHWDAGFLAIVTLNIEPYEGSLKIYSVGSTYTLVDEIALDLEGSQSQPSSNSTDHSIIWAKDVGAGYRLLVTNGLYFFDGTTISLVDYITSNNFTSPYNPFFISEISG